jgi:hypothetical protein
MDSSNTSMQNYNEVIIHKLAIMSLFFLCFLSNNTVTNSDYTALNYWVIANNELEGILKEMVLAKF